MLFLFFSYSSSTLHILFAGTPAITLPFSKLLVTTLPAPTIQLSARVTPGSNILPTPMKQLSPISFIDLSRTLVTCLSVKRLSSSQTYMSREFPKTFIALLIYLLNDSPKYWQFFCSHSHLHTDCWHCSFFCILPHLPKAF